MSRLSKHAVLSAAVAATLAGSKLFASTPDGSIAGDYGGTALTLQGTATGFGDNQNELDGLYGQYTLGGDLQFALTGNLDGNGIVFFLDSGTGGGIANTAPGNFNQFGSMGGERLDDWGTDVDGGDPVGPTPGGGSIVSSGFNPEKALQIGLFGGTYYINVIDLTQSNDSTHPNKDIFLNTPSGSTPNGTPTQNTYYRDGGATDSGDVTHAFVNTNSAGITGDSNNLGDPATATTGFEALLENQFVNHNPGKAIRLLAVLTNGNGEYLSNQFLPKVRYHDSGNLETAGGWGGNPLVDYRTEAFNGDSFVTLWEPTFAISTDNKWSTGGNWNGAVAPNGVEHDAAFKGAGETLDLDVDVTLGTIKFAGTGNYTIQTSTSKTIRIDAGNGAARIDVNGFSNTIDPKVTFASDTRINTAVADVSFGETDNSAAKRILITGIGTVNFNGAQTNGDGAGIAIDGGNVNIGSDGGSLGTHTQRIFVGTEGGGAAHLNFNSSQHLKELAINPAGVVELTSNGSREIVTPTFSMDPGAKLDLHNNNLIVQAVDATDAATKYAAIEALVKSGFGNFDWLGTGITSAEAATQAQIDGSLAVGVINNTDWGHSDIEGEPVGPNDIIAKHTWVADANVDGLVDNDDFGQFLFGFSGAGAPVWLNGDFDYNGVVDNDDFGWFLTGLGAFQASGNMQLSDSLKADLAAFASEQGIPLVLDPTPVPEPTTLGILGLVGAGMLARRRRMN